MGRSLACSNCTRKLCIAHLLFMHMLYFDASAKHQIICHCKLSSLPLLCTIYNFSLTQWGEQVRSINKLTNKILHILKPHSLTNAKLINLILHILTPHLLQIHWQMPQILPFYCLWIRFQKWLSTQYYHTVNTVNDSRTHCHMHLGFVTKQSQSLTSLCWLFPSIHLALNLLVKASWVSFKHGVDQQAITLAFVNEFQQRCQIVQE